MNPLVQFIFLLCLISTSCAKNLHIHDSEVLDITERGGLNEMLIDLIEKIKLIMSCGIHELGVPVMAPLVLNHTSFTVDQSGWIHLDASFDDVLIEDLNKFDIIDLDVKIFQLRINLNLSFNSIKIVGKYMAEGKAFRLIPFNRSGSFSMDINGLHLDGTVKIGMNSTKISINEFKIRPTINSVHSRFEEVFLVPLNTLIFNKIVEGIIPKLLRDYQQKVTQVLEDFIKPKINGLLGGYTLEDLGDLIADNSTLPSIC